MRAEDAIELRDLRVEVEVLRSRLSQVERERDDEAAAAGAMSSDLTRIAAELDEAIAALRGLVTYIEDHGPSAEAEELCRQVRAAHLTKEEQPDTLS